MRQIAAGAGLAVGGIYNHFPSQEAVFAAVLDTYHPYHVILPALQQARGDNLDEFVRYAARQVQGHMQGQEDRLLPLVFIELVEFQGRHLRALAEKTLPTLIEFVQRFVERSGGMIDIFLHGIAAGPRPPAGVEA